MCARSLSCSSRHRWSTVRRFADKVARWATSVKDNPPASTRRSPEFCAVCHHSALCFAVIHSVLFPVRRLSTALTQYRHTLPSPLLRRLPPFRRVKNADSIGGFQCRFRYPECYHRKLHRATLPSIVHSLRHPYAVEQFVRSKTGWGR